MNYELCKKLKDAGFPQETKSYYFYSEYEGGEWGICRDFEEVEKIAAPTLSELIEACGDGIDNIYRVSDMIIGVEEMGAGWHACDGKGKEIYGKTPEEAVARLWLELNR